MTGDGVNAPALKRADIGIAMASAVPRRPSKPRKWCWLMTIFATIAHEWIEEGARSMTILKPFVHPAEPVRGEALIPLSPP
jgi:magnesium-transporting ATPase (P-type)